MWCVSGDEQWADGPAQLCVGCLDVARRDLTGLVRDYVDLENVLAEVAGRLERVTGTRDRSIPLAVGAEALQRDIWHLLTTWEEIIIEHCGLRATPAGQTRDGFAVQRAARLLMPRLKILAGLGAWAVFPTGTDNPPADVTGAEAILAMRALHHRVGWAIGLRHLVHALAGACWQCGIHGGLRRNDGSEKVWCELCKAVSTWDDYMRETRAEVINRGH
jgi:hypothetical protein